MTRSTTAAIAVSVVVIVGAWGNAQTSSGALDGAWEVQEITFAQPGLPVNKPAGLYLFTGKHYALLQVADTARPSLTVAEEANATADQLRAVWGPFQANAGTFEISGTTLTTRPTVAKNPVTMSAGFFNEFSFTLNGDTLLLTQVKSRLGAFPNPATVRLTRVK
jgi:Lipocalin-like domain